MSKLDQWQREANSMEAQLENPDLDDEEREQIERALSDYDEKVNRC